MNKQIIFVMGVSGCGKSTIGKRLADKLHLPFFDGDDYHPAENVSKMQAGIPLEDSDRYSWLKQLHTIAIDALKNKGCIIACSALKESYRLLLMEGIEEHVQWIHLEGTYKLIKERMEKRDTHFMPTGLLSSQFNTLEVPAYAMRISIDSTPEKITEQIIDGLEH